MKKIVTLVLVCVGLTAFAQNKNAKASMMVDGVCGMCKARIEKACLNTKGVKYADWNMDTHQLNLVFDERKTNADSIKNEVLAAGHDVQDAKASADAYAKVHGCCKYREESQSTHHQK